MKNQASTSTLREPPTFAGLSHIETELQRGGHDIPVRVEINGREWAGDDETGEYVPGIGEVEVISNVYSEAGDLAFPAGTIKPTRGEYQMLRDLAATEMREQMEPDYSTDTDPAGDAFDYFDMVRFPSMDDGDQQPQMHEAA